MTTNNTLLHTPQVRGPVNHVNNIKWNLSDNVGAYEAPKREDDMAFLKRYVSELSKKQTPPVVPTIHEILSESLEYTTNHLPTDQKLSVQMYTSSAYGVINDGVKKRDMEPTSMFLPVVKEVDNAFKKAPRLKHPIIVYRGISPSKDPFHITGPFISTSTNPDIAKTFAGLDGFLLEIEVAAGTPVLAVKNISLHPYEEEIILPRAGKVKVIAHTKEPFTQRERIKLGFESAPHMFEYMYPEPASWKADVQSIYEDAEFNTLNDLLQNDPSKILMHFGSNLDQYLLGIIKLLGPVVKEIIVTSWNEVMKLLHLSVILKRAVDLLQQIRNAQ